MLRWWVRLVWWRRLRAEFRVRRSGWLAPMSGRGFRVLRWWVRLVWWLRLRRVCRVCRGVVRWG